MEDFNFTKDEIKSAEREHIENLILGGASPEDILKKFPHYRNAEIENIVENIACFLWSVE